MSIGKIQRASALRMLDISNMSKTLKEVISDRLSELDRNPFEAARKARLERSYLNDILIGKKLSVRQDRLPQLAVALDWEDHELMSALGREPGEVRQGSVVAVHGRIGAGQQILPEFEQAPADGLFQIEVVLDLPDDAIAFEVTGESMWPRYDEGDIIICWNRTVDVITIIGWEAAVRTADGRRYLKRVVEGSIPETFTLESHNARPIENVRLEWVSPVEHVVRAGRWQKLGAAERKAQLRRSMRRPTKS